MRRRLVPPSPTGRRPPMGNPGSATDNNVCMHYVFALRRNLKRRFALDLEIFLVSNACIPCMPRPDAKNSEEHAKVLVYLSFL